MAAAASTHPAPLGRLMPLPAFCASCGCGGGEHPPCTPCAPHVPAGHLRFMPPLRTAAGQLPPPPRRTRSSPERQGPDGNAVARLEAEKAELSAELSTVQGRLHDALVRGQCQSAVALPSAAATDSKQQRAGLNQPRPCCPPPIHRRRCWRVCLPSGPPC